MARVRLANDNSNLGWPFAPGVDLLVWVSLVASSSDGRVSLSDVYPRLSPLPIHCGDNLTCSNLPRPPPKEVASCVYISRDFGGIDALLSDEDYRTDGARRIYCLRDIR